jgi:hypothetical protein
MTIELKKLSPDDDMDIYNLLQEIPKALALSDQFELFKYFNK